MLDLLPDPMREPTVLAIPFFVTMLAIEWFAAYKLEESDDDGRAPKGAYEKRDARASLSMGVVLSLIHISEPTRRLRGSRMPSSA